LLAEFDLFLTPQHVCLSTSFSVFAINVEIPWLTRASFFRCCRTGVATTVEVAAVNIRLESPKKKSGGLRNKAGRKLTALRTIAR
jgi:hypothetical protein